MQRSAPAFGPQLLTVADACRILKISRSSFYRIARTSPGFPSVIKIGHGTRIREADLHAYLAEGAGAPGDR